MTKKKPQFALPRSPLSETEYSQLWKECGPIRIRMIEKTGKCEHEVGQTFQYVTPYDRPEGVCAALLHVLDLYTWRVAMGFPSWEEDDRRVFRIHCPSKTGTVWEMRRVVAGDEG
jgi:uncharacterized repeat protein (TIGR04076 family)